MYYLSSKVHKKATNNELSMIYWLQHASLLLNASSAEGNAVGNTWPSHQIIYNTDSNFRRLSKIQSQHAIENSE